MCHLNWTPPTAFVLIFYAVAVNAGPNRAMRMVLFIISPAIIAVMTNDQFWRPQNRPQFVHLSVHHPPTQRRKLSQILLLHVICAPLCPHLNATVELSLCCSPLDGAVCYKNTVCFPIN